MKTITTLITVLLLLFHVAFLDGHIIGGVNTSFAAEAYPERGIYAVTIENNDSKVTTVMTVFAISETEAHDLVALNGWSVIGVKRIDEKEAKMFPLAIEIVNNNPTDVKIDSFNNKPKPEPIAEIDDNLNLLPTSPNLSFVATYFFDFAIIEAIKNPTADMQLETLNKDDAFVVFGFADKVNVGKHAQYNNNFELSFKRAEYIKDYMVQRGFTADKIRTVGLGTLNPVEDTNKSSSANRRAEIYKFKKQTQNR